MQELKIRRIEDHILARLKEEAQRQNIGLETLARRILEDYALHPEIRKLEDKCERMVRNMTALYRLMTEEMEQALIQNTKMLEKVNDTIVGGTGGRK